MLSTYSSIIYSYILVYLRHIYYFFSIKNENFIVSYFAFLLNAFKSRSNN